MASHEWLIRAAVWGITLGKMITMVTSCLGS